MSGIVRGYHMVLDVEGVGLYGEAFAFGYVVVALGGAVKKDPSTRLVHEDFAWTSSSSASGSKAGRTWIEANVPERVRDGDWSRDGSYVRTRRELRSRFWRSWRNWRAQGCRLWADVAWPVEAGFLLECVRDEDDIGYGDREQEGPYPLLDVSTLESALGVPVWPRLESAGELPEHDPLADARYSARKLERCFQLLEKAEVAR